jgi:ATP-binding cassette subfamily F protein uup
VGETKTGKAELASAVVAAAPAPAPEAAPLAKKKLSYKVQRELEALPAQIDALEVQIAALEAEIGGPAFYQQSAEKSAEVLARLQSVQHELDKLLERWAELEG